MYLKKFLKNKFNPPPYKILYFSDAAAAQYKNRKNLSTTKQTLELMLNGISLRLLMERGLNCEVQ